MPRVPASPILRLLCFVGLLTLLAACSDSPAPAGEGAHDTIEFVLGPRTKQLDERAIAALSMGADTSQTLSFESSVGSGFARGDILMAGVTPKTPRGLLRLVRDVKTDGATTTVDTMLVPLQLAFKKLNVHVERTLDTSSASPELPKPTRPLVTVFDLGGNAFIDEDVFNGDGKPGTLEDQLHLKNLYEGYTALTFDLSFDWGFVDNIVNGIDHLVGCTISFGFAPGCEPISLPSLSVEMQFKASVATTFDQSGAASIAYKPKTFEIGVPKTFDPITIGPLVFVPELKFTGSSEGSAGSYNRLAGHSELGFSVSASISTSSPIPKVTAEPTKSFKVDVVEAFLDAHTSTSIGPRLDMLAYGAIGPTVGVVFVSELDVDRTRGADCYRASQGVDGTFGFVVKFPWQAIGDFIGNKIGTPDLGSDLRKVAGIFGLDGSILDVSKALHILPLSVVDQGVCRTPPASALPPGTPRDDTFANPPFVPWSQRFDEEGYHFKFSASPHNTRGRLAIGADGHYWGLGSPSTVVRRIALDGTQLSARRFLQYSELDDKDVPLAVSDVLVRHDLETWIVFENGTVARLSPKGVLVDAYRYTVPLASFEESTLRMATTAPDGRSALVFGIRQASSNRDHRSVIVELTPNGSVQRAQSIGYDTSADVTTQYFTAVRAIYNQAGDLVLAGNDTPSKTADDHCVVYSLKPGGELGFATNLATTVDQGHCEVGSLSETASGDFILTATNGANFANAAMTIFLNKDGTFQRGASWALGGDSLIQPSALMPLPTSGYVIAGLNSLSASHEHIFVARFDATGAPVSAKSYRPKTDGVRLGFPDALLTKDAGVIFGGLGDWADFSNGTHLTRFFAGKVFAKDGALPMAPAADAETVDLQTAAGNLTIVGQAFTRPLAPVAVTVAGVVVKNEDQPLSGTRFAP